MRAAGQSVALIGQCPGSNDRESPGVRDPHCAALHSDESPAVFEGIDYPQIEVRHRRSDHRRVGAGRLVEFDDHFLDQGRHLVRIGTLG